MASPATSTASRQDRQDSVGEDGKILPQWIDSDSCMACQASFSLFFRKHHCRYCGKCFCGGCTDKTQMIPISPSYPEKERVCNKCYDRLEEEKTSGNSSGVRAIWLESDRCLHPNCNKTFSTFFRRHHCRGCGRSFCGDHSNKQYLLPASFGFQGQQRVCDGCFFYLMETEYRAGASEGKTELPDYAEVEKKMLLDAVEQANTPQTEWLQRADHRGVTVHSKPLQQSAIQCVRTVVNVPVPPAQTIKMYTDQTLLRTWNKDMIDIRQLEAVGPQRSVIYVSYRLPVVDNRDGVIYTVGYTDSLLRAGDNAFEDIPGNYTILSTSVNHPLCPPIEGFVRANVNISVTTFEAIDEPVRGTRIVNFLHTDPRGLIPPFLINQQLSSACDTIADMVDVMTKRYQAEVA